jgi:hypothetical protein
MRFAAVLILTVTFSAMAADDAVKPPAPPADEVATAPEEKRVNRQPQRKSKTDEERAESIAATKHKRAVKALEKEIAGIEKDIAANKADLAATAGVANTETMEVKRVARENIRVLEKELKTKTKELEALRAE